MGLKPPRAKPRAWRAFEELLSEHLDALYRTALRCTHGHEADAEDLLQEAVLRAFRGLPELRDPAAARSWLFTILTRTHLNRCRSQRRRAESLASDMSVEAFERALESWQPVPLPDQVTERWQLRQRLSAALHDLPVELASVVWLVDFEGFSQREAAEMYRVPEGTVASRLFRARRELRRILRGLADELGVSSARGSGAS